jgi:hypothetical protein
MSVIINRHAIYLGLLVGVLVSIGETTLASAQERSATIGTAVPAQKGHPNFYALVIDSNSYE